MKLPLTFISVQPATLYWAWQVEVMLTNFRDCGIAKEYKVQCLFGYNTKESDWKQKVEIVSKVQDKFKGVAEFYFYEDNRKTLHYPSSLRPNILKQHFKNSPELCQSAIFYHDCDIVFTKFPDFLENLLENDMKWYVSDTKSYIGHNYIKSKGDDVLQSMCEIVGINPKLVENKEQESGGAQYLLKGLDWRFFEKMEQDCEILFKDITDLNNRKKAADPNHHELQIWCSDMWAMLWGGWMRGYESIIIPEMDFCWATDQADRWHKVYIYHNAGVVKAGDKLFYKGAYINKLPFLESGDDLDRNRASFKYFSIIKSIGEQSCLIGLDTVAAPVPISLEIITPDQDFLNLNVIKRAQNRFAICKSCENFTTSATGLKICKLCGCQTEKRIISEDKNDCPLNKWVI